MKGSQKKPVTQSLNGSKEKSKIEVFIYEIKNASFSVLFVLLKEENEGEDDRRSKMIETVFEYLQTVNFIFEDKVRDIWNSSRFFGVIISVVTFFDISSKFGSILTVQFFFIQFYLLVALILFIVCDIVYVSVSFKRKKFTAIWPLKVLRNFVRLAVTIFFQPVVETLLTMVC